MKFEKKKSFWKVFLDECAGVILAGTIMIYIALSAIIGNLILPYINNEKEINPYIEGVSSKFVIFLIKTTIGAIWLFGIIFILLVAFAIIGIIVIAIVTGITHIAAVKRYTYLPLTTNEVREATNAGLFKDTPESYIDYLTKQMQYYGDSITFSVDDMKLITKTVKEIWNESFKLNKDFLIRNKIESYDYLPFEFRDDRDDLFCQLKKGKTVTFDMDEGSLIQTIK
ncbi:MAG: hypothetical protein ACLUVX_08870 [Lachnospira pectinoschiza]